MCRDAEVKEEGFLEYINQLLMTGEVAGLLPKEELRGLARCARRDAEVKEEGFLEYINQLLMTGEVAGLLPKEELDAMLNDVRPAFKRECLGAPTQSKRVLAV